MMVAKLDSSFDSFDRPPINPSACRAFVPGGPGWNLLKPRRTRIGITLILTTVSQLYSLVG